jgi:hypothetical protein
MSTIEELFGRKSDSYGLENLEYSGRDAPRWPHNTLYPQKLALTSPTGGGRSVGIVRSRTKASLLLLLLLGSRQVILIPLCFPQVMLDVSFGTYLYSVACSRNV